MLINNWLHPLGAMEGNLAAVWHIESEILGRATTRKTCSPERQQRCVRIVLNKLPDISEEDLIVKGFNDEAFYLELLQRCVDIQIAQYNDLWGDRWMTS